jgi:hypothetical protein
MQRGLASLRDDPQEHFRCTSPEQRRFLAELRYGEIYLHSGNKFGKTTIGAQAGVALAKCLTHLDGVELPALPSPNVGIVLSLDYKQQRLSVQPAYLAALGNWPHKAEWNGATLVSLRVKPIGCKSDDPRDWSLILFYSQENRRSGVGARGHWVHADEPPREEIWREVRKMAEPGALFISFITATALKRSQWYWLREDYPVEYEGKRVNGFLRLRAATFNPDDPDDMSVGNAAIPPAERRELLRLYASDPHRIARITGIEIDTANASPFKAVYDELRRWLDDATEPEWTDWKVSREVLTAEGKKLVSETVEVASWEEPDPACVYRIIADTSLGIDDDEHDPCMAQVVNMTTGQQAARYRGYLGEYGLGVLCAGLSKQYGEARVDPAVTGGYGSAFLSGLRAAGCRNVVSHTTPAKNGALERTHIGFTENAESRGMFAAAIREALVGSQQGVRWLTVRCREDVLELMDLSMDAKGRVVHDDGSHDEAFVTLGRAATLLLPKTREQRIPRVVQRNVVTPTRSPMDLLRSSIGAERGRVQAPRPQVRKALRPVGPPR